VALANIVKGASLIVNDNVTDYTTGLVRGLSVVVPGSVEIGNERYAVIDPVYAGWTDHMGDYARVSVKKYKLFQPGPFFRGTTIKVYCYDGPAVNPEARNPGCTDHNSYNPDCNNCRAMYATRVRLPDWPIDGDQIHQLYDDTTAYLLYEAALAPPSYVIATALSEIKPTTVANAVQPPTLVWSEAVRGGISSIAIVGAGLQPPEVKLKEYLVRRGSTFVPPEDGDVLSVNIKNYQICSLSIYPRFSHFKQVLMQIFDVPVYIEE